MQKKQNCDIENISDCLNDEKHRELNIENNIIDDNLSKKKFITHIKLRRKSFFYLASFMVCATTGVFSFLSQRDKDENSTNEFDTSTANLIDKNINEVTSIEVINEDIKNLPKTRMKEDLLESTEIQKEEIVKQELTDKNSVTNNMEEIKKEENYSYNLEEKLNPSSQNDINPVPLVEDKPMTSNSVTNAMRYWNYFEYYGNTYGVDPYLLVAISCQESRGDHWTTIPGGKYYNGAGYGIMQIERPGKRTKQITAYNHVSKVYETMIINSENDVYEIENNIKAGAMMLAQRAKEQQYNPYVTIQGYNYGVSGIKYAISYYIADGDINKVEEIYGDGKGEHLLYYIAINNSDWVNKPTSSTLTAREWYSSEGWKKFGSGRGDKNYIENIMRFYTGSEKPYIIKNTGEKVSF